MKSILTAEIATFLASDANIASLTKGHIYTKQISAYRNMPAISVFKISQASAESHSGPLGVYSSAIRLYVFARTLLEVEEIKERINGLLDGLSVGLDGIDANFALTNDADYDEDALLQSEEWCGVLEYECNWSYS